MNHRSFHCEGSRRAGGAAGVMETHRVATREQGAQHWRIWPEPAGGAAGVMGLREGGLQQIHLSRRFLPKVSQIVVSQDLAKAT